MSGEEEPVVTTAALLAELKASRLATEKLTEQFSAFKSDTDAKIANLTLQNEKLRAGQDASDDEDDLVYVAHIRSENPFPDRPKNCTVKPQPFDLYGDRTADCLEAKANSSLRWEYRTLAPSLSYFFDAKAVYDGVREDVLEKLGEEESLALEGVFNTLDGVYQMFTQRYATIKIRSRAEAEPGGLSDENKLLLDFLDTQLHGVFPGEALVDSKVEGWLQDFRVKKAAVELKAAAGSAGPSKGKARATENATEPPGKVRFEKRAKAKKQGVQPKPKPN